MSSDIAIKVENLSKCYHIYDQPRDRLLQMLARGRKQYFREFWALKDVSLEIKKGDTVGIIGRNGSGKSTLLQMICGTLNPTSGHVQTNGRIGALLELGSGFNPEFSGRENVYLNGTVLGLSTEEIDNCYDEILSFADIGQFIDQPVKTYSSGMVIRLAFAVQSQIDPSILVVDEALAVGDAKFQAKCFGRLRELKEKGTSILLVTHSGEQIVTHCAKALLLDQGQVQLIGEPRTVVNRYLDLLFGKDKLPGLEAPPLADPDIPDKSIAESVNTAEDVFATRPGYNHHEYRWGDGAATLLDYSLSSDSEHFPTAITSGAEVNIEAAVRFNTAIFRPIFGVTIKTKEGVTVYGTNSELLSQEHFCEMGQESSVAIATFSFHCNLAPGDYFVSLGIASRHREEVIPHDRRYDAIHLVVLPNDQFFGISNLGLKMQARQAIG